MTVASRPKILIVVAILPTLASTRMPKIFGHDSVLLYIDLGPLVSA
jgi:hypothetical protein